MLQWHAETCGWMGPTPIKLLYLIHPPTNSCLSIQFLIGYLPHIQIPFASGLHTNTTHLPHLDNQTTTRWAPRYGVRPLRCYPACVGFEKRVEQVSRYSCVLIMIPYNQVKRSQQDTSSFGCVDHRTKDADPAELWYLNTPHNLVTRDTHTQGEIIRHV